MAKIGNNLTNQNYRVGCVCVCVCVCACVCVYWLGTLVSTREIQIVLLIWNVDSQVIGDYSAKRNPDYFDNIFRQHNFS